MFVLFLMTPTRTTFCSAHNTLEQAKDAIDDQLYFHKNKESWFMIVRAEHFVDCDSL